MLKFARFFVKGILLLLSILVLTIAISGIYISLNQKELGQKFLGILEDEINLNFSYSDFKLSLVSNFPFASFNFENLEIKLKNTSKPITLLTAQKVNLTINTVNLIQGKFNIRNCIVNNGVLNYYQKPIDSLINEFTNSSSNENASNYFSLNKFTIKDYFINIYDTNSKLLVNLKVNNALINIDLNDEKVSAYTKCKLSEIKTDKILINNTPIDVELTFEGNKGEYNIPQLNLNINKIGITGSGVYNHKSGASQIKFTTNTFETNRLSDVLKINLKDIVFDGKTKASGNVFYNIKINKLNKLIVNHKSSGRLKYGETSIVINEINANTTISDDYRTHNTNFSKIDIEYKNLKAIMSCRIKGTNKPIILMDGEISLKNHTVEFYDKSLTIDANGKIKALLSMDSLSANKLNYHSIKGALNYNINKINGIDRIKDISGTITLDRNLIINSTGKFDEKPFELTFNQNNILNIVNSNSSINPFINIKSESVDIDYITKLVDELPEENTTEGVDRLYTISIESNYLRFMNYDFQKVKSHLILKNDIFEIQNFSGIGFDGKINGSLKNINNLYFINTSFENLNISKLFKHYNDFDQTIVSHTNINGSLSGDAYLKFSTDEKGNISYPTLKLESDVTVKDGKLIGMNKIDKLSKWLKLDQVKSIDFKTLHNRIEISYQCVRIPRMDVFSNVINMEISGEHYFTGNYTYWMKINFSQVLSRRFLNSSSFSETENTSNGAINLYLKLTGDNNDYEVSIDKKSSFEKIKGNLNTEGNTIKEIMKEEYKMIMKKDTSKNPEKDSSLLNNTKFNIEWDEYDTLNVDNN